MSRIVSLHDRSRLERRLRRDPDLHVYSLGDLDDRYFPHTLWFGLEEDGELAEVALLYIGGSLPTLLALCEESTGATGRMRGLLRGIGHLLPERFYAHLTPGVADGLPPRFRELPHGFHLKMALRPGDATRVRPDQEGRTRESKGMPAELPAADAEDKAGIREGEIVTLGPSDLRELRSFYERAYPETFFAPASLETGFVLGLREEGDLRAVAGVHVVSPALRVAALGNVATLPEHRGRGLARRVCAALIASLEPVADHIGLNVASHNESAIACYRRLGFREVARYEEATFEKA